MLAFLVVAVIGVVVTLPSHTMACKHLCISPLTNNYVCCDADRPRYGDSGNSQYVDGGNSHYVNGGNSQYVDGGNSQYVDGDNPHYGNGGSQWYADVDDVGSSVCLYYCNYNDQVYCCDNGEGTREYFSPQNHDPYYKGPDIVEERLPPEYIVPEVPPGYQSISHPNSFRSQPNAFGLLRIVNEDTEEETHTSSFLPFNIASIFRNPLNSIFRSGDENEESSHSSNNGGFINHVMNSPSLGRLAFDSLMSMIPSGFAERAETPKSLDESYFDKRQIDDNNGQFASPSKNRISNSLRIPTREDGNSIIRGTGHIDMEERITPILSAAPLVNSFAASSPARKNPSAEVHAVPMDNSFASSGFSDINSVSNGIPLISGDSVHVSNYPQFINHVRSSPSLGRLAFDSIMSMIPTGSPEEWFATQKSSDESNIDKRQIELAPVVNSFTVSRPSGEISFSEISPNLNDFNSVSNGVPLHPVSGGAPLVPIDNLFTSSNLFDTNSVPNGVNLHPLFENSNSGGVSLAAALNRLHTQNTIEAPLSVTQESLKTEETLDMEIEEIKENVSILIKHFKDLSNANPVLPVDENSVPEGVPLDPIDDTFASLNISNMNTVLNGIPLLPAPLVPISNLFDINSVSSGVALPSTNTNSIPRDVPLVQIEDSFTSSNLFDINSVSSGVPLPSTNTNSIPRDVPLVPIEDSFTSSNLFDINSVSSGVPLPSANINPIVGGVPLVHTDNSFASSNLANNNSVKNGVPLLPVFRNLFDINSRLRGDPLSDINLVVNGVPLPSTNIKFDSGGAPVVLNDDSFASSNVSDLNTVINVVPVLPVVESSASGVSLISIDNSFALSNLANINSVSNVIPSLPVVKNSVSGAGPLVPFDNSFISPTISTINSASNGVSVPSGFRHFVSDGDPLVPIQNYFASPNHPNMHLFSNGARLPSRFRNSFSGGAPLVPIHNSFASSNLPLVYRKRRIPLVPIKNSFKSSKRPNNFSVSNGVSFPSGFRNYVSGGPPFVPIQNSFASSNRPNINYVSNGVSLPSGFRNSVLEGFPLVPIQNSFASSNRPNINSVSNEVTLLPVVKNVGSGVESLVPIDFASSTLTDINTLLNEDPLFPVVSSSAPQGIPLPLDNSLASSNPSNVNFVSNGVPFTPIINSFRDSDSLGTSTDASGVSLKPDPSLLSDIKSVMKRLFEYPKDYFIHKTYQFLSKKDKLIDSLQNTLSRIVEPPIGVTEESSKTGELRELKEDLTKLMDEVKTLSNDPLLPVIVPEDNLNKDETSAAAIPVRSNLSPLLFGTDDKTKIRGTEQTNVEAPLHITEESSKTKAPLNVEMKEIKENLLTIIKEIENLSKDSTLPKTVSVDSLNNDATRTAVIPVGSDISSHPLSSYPIMLTPTEHPPLHKSLKNSHSALTYDPPSVKVTPDFILTGSDTPGIPSAGLTPPSKDLRFLSVSQRDSLIDILCYLGQSNSHAVTGRCNLTDIIGKSSKLHKDDIDIDQIEDIINSDLSIPSTLIPPSS